LFEAKKRGIKDIYSWNWEQISDKKLLEKIAKRPMLKASFA